MVSKILSRTAKSRKQTYLELAKSAIPPRFVLLVILLFIVLRIPSLFELFWYGDEGIYGSIARGMHDGKVLYSDVWDHKPPLIYVLYYLTGFWGPAVNIFLMKLLSTVAGVISIYFVQKILQHFGLKNVFQMLALAVFAFLIGTPILEGNSANAEVFFVPINILIFYLLLTKQRYGLVGVLAFLSFALKTTGFIESAFLIFVFGLLSFWGDKEEFRNILKRSSIGFLVPLAIMCGWLAAAGALKDFVNAAFVYSFGYSSAMAHTVNFLGVEWSPSIFKICTFLFVFLLSMYLYVKRFVSRKFFLVINLFAIEIYASVLSGRNYTHYLLQVAPAAVLLLGIGMQKFAEEQNALKRFLYVAIFVITTHFVLYAFTGGAPLPNYAPIRQYYPAFVKDARSGFAANAFWWRNGNDTMRMQRFANAFNDKYNYKFSNYYLFSSEPWLTTLVDMPSTNKVFVAWQIYYTPELHSEEVQNRNRAELLIVDTTYSNEQEFLGKLDHFQKIDEIEQFAIYKNLRVQHVKSQ